MSKRVAFLVASVVAVLVGFFLIALSFYYNINSLQFPLFLGLGCALLPGGIFALITDASFEALLASIIVKKVEELATRQAESVDKKVHEVVGKLDTSLEALSSSTNYLSQSKSLGIVMAYPDRRAALEVFLQYLGKYVADDSIPKRELIVVGSSVKGMIEKHPELGRQFSRIIKQGIQSNCEIRVLLTHPAYSRYREIQESRQPYDIAKEILHAISWLESQGLPSKQIKLYKGTPTTFMIATHERMLLNFYPYQTEAFNCFCLEVQDTLSDSCIFRSFYDNHFHKPWMGELDERDHFIQTNSLRYIHQPLDGPVADPQQILDDMKGPFGDFFVIDDEGTFYLAVNLRRVKRQVVYSRSEDAGQKVITIGRRLEIKLLSLQEGNHSDWVSHGFIDIDDDHRNGFWDKTIRDITYNSVSMLGLFDPGNDNVFKHTSTHPTLIGKPLPMLYKWLNPSSNTNQSQI